MLSEHSREDEDREHRDGRAKANSYFHSFMARLANSRLRKSARLGELVGGTGHVGGRRNKDGFPKHDHKTFGVNAVRRPTAA